MTAKVFRLVLTGAAGALLLAGCASTPPVSAVPPGDTANMAGTSAIDCQAFARRMAAYAAAQTDPAVPAVPSPDPLAAANTSAAEAEAGDDGEVADAAPPPTLATLPLFSVSPHRDQLPVGWQPWTINRNKTPTRYSMAEVDQRVVVHAQAESSASGLYVPLRERDAGMLRWTWKTSSITAMPTTASARARTRRCACLSPSTATRVPCP